MFRDLARKNKRLTEDACLSLLQSERRGVLSVTGDDGYPYGMPMNHFYNPDDGCIYFHCGRAGHRLDALRRDNRVSFCVMEQGEAIPGDWALAVRSVIVFGRMEVLDDPALTADIAARLSRCFTQDEAYIREEIRKYGPGTLLLRLKPEHMCGKRVEEK